MLIKAALIVKSSYNGFRVIKLIKCNGAPYNNMHILIKFS